MPTYKDMSEAEWNKLLEYATAHDAVRVLGEIVFARLAPRAVLEEMRITSPEHAPDWTAQNGVPNASPTYLECVGIVVRAIMDGAHDLLDGGVHGVARAIVSELAHKHGLIPETPSKLGHVEAQRDTLLEHLHTLAKELYGGAYTGVDALLAVVRRLKAASERPAILLGQRERCPMTLSGECKALRDIGKDQEHATDAIGPAEAQAVAQAVRRAAEGYCDWTKHGGRQYDGRYKSECRLCMDEAADRQAEIVREAMVAAYARGREVRAVDKHLGPYDAQQRERLTKEAIADMKACTELAGFSLPETRDRAAFILHELEALAAMREGR